MSGVKLEKESTKEQGRENNLFSKVYKSMIIGASCLAFAGPMKDSATSKELSAGTHSRATSTTGIPPKIGLSAETEMSKKYAGSDFQRPEMRATFFEVDQEGHLKFNIWSLAALLQAEVPYTSNENGKITVRLPFEYARLFAQDEKADKLHSPEDLKKIGEFVDQEFQKQFAEILYGWDWSKKIYQSHHEEPPTNMEIKNIEITGTASPEGPRGKSAETIKYGAIDQENIELAFKRGRIGIEIAKEWLGKSGVNLKQLEEAASKMQVKEIQFSNRELFELAILSRKIRGNDEMEKIYNLIKDYNAKKIQDKDIVEQLDQMIGMKRLVEITINYEKREKRRILIPIPLLPIIIGVSLPSFTRRRNRKLETERKIAETSSILQTTKLPPENSPEYQDMKERVVIDDFGMFFDKKETAERGLNYRNLTDDVQRRYNDFKNSAEREIFLTNEILKAWKAHDIKCRQEAGIPSDRIESGLDYENQPYQIRWAKMHARILIILADKNRRIGRDYRNTLDEMISNILKQKGER